MNPLHTQHMIREPEDVGAARRWVERDAKRAGMDDVRAAEAGLVTTELGTNLLRHAHPGGYLLTAVQQGPAVEILSLDRGPGLTSIDTAIKDWGDDWEGRKPGGLGAGLGAVRRLASEFDGYSRKGQGTVLLARLRSGPKPAHKEFAIGAVCLAQEGMTVSGDSWGSRAESTTMEVVVIDGLGHGPDAAEAAVTGVRAFIDAATVDIDEQLTTVHQAMIATRGGVAAIARASTATNRLEYVSVGNISGRVVTNGTSRGLVSNNGTMGIELRRPRASKMVYDWNPGSSLIVFTDGLRDRFEHPDYPGLLEHDPTLVAAVLYRDNYRGRDDATAVVIKDLRASGP